MGGPLRQSAELMGAGQTHHSRRSIALPEIGAGCVRDLSRAIPQPRREVVDASLAFGIFLLAFPVDLHFHGRARLSNRDSIVGIASRRRSRHRPDILIDGRKIGRNGRELISLLRLASGSVSTCPSECVLFACIHATSCASPRPSRRSWPPLTSTSKAVCISNSSYFRRWRVPPASFLALSHQPYSLLGATKLRFGSNAGSSGFPATASPSTVRKPCTANRRRVLKAGTFSQRILLVDLSVGSAVLCVL